MNWLNYHHLQYFWTVAREGSVSAAARSLRIAQPTVSTQVKQLEEQLGERLFERSGRGLVLIARRSCDLAQLVLQDGCGIVVEPGEATELADQLLQLSRNPEEVLGMGRRAASLYRRQFGLERSLNSYESVLCAAAASVGPPAR